LSDRMRALLLLFLLLLGLAGGMSAGTAEDDAAAAAAASDNFFNIPSPAATEAHDEENNRRIQKALPLIFKLPLLPPNAPGAASGISCDFASETVSYHPPAAGSDDVGPPPSNSSNLSDWMTCLLAAFMQSISFNETRGGYAFLLEHTTHGKRDSARKSLLRAANLTVCDTIKITSDSVVVARVSALTYAST